VFIGGTQHARGLDAIIQYTRAVQPVIVAVELRESDAVNVDA